MAYIYEDPYLRVSTKKNLSVNNKTLKLLKGNINEYFYILTVWEGFLKKDIKKY